MSDHSELKRLAEAATPGPWAYDGSYVCPARTEDGTTYVELWRSIADCHQPENTKFIAAANPAAVLALIAEVEALRDDLEQVKYDASAWRNGEESVWVEVFYSEGDDPFICSISGQITVEQLNLIQSEMLEYREDYFEKGSGLYVFRCAHYQAHHDNVGMTEPAHWETDLESYSPFPWDEEREAMAEGDKP